MRDILRGAVASFFGYGGRMIARGVLLVFAARLYGIEALGVLGQVAAITEIAAAIGVMGLKRSLLDILSHDAEKNEALEPRIVEALSVAVFFSILISAVLIFVWRALLPDLPGVIALLFFAAPAIVVTEVALAAIKYKRIIFWDVLARGVAEPWGILALAIICYQLGYQDGGLLIAYSGSFLISAICAGAGLVHTYGARALIRSHPSRARALSLPKRSAPVGLTDIGVMALRRLDLVVLSVFASAEAIGLYYLVQQLATIPQKIYPLFESMLSPVIARLHNRLDDKKIRSNLIGVCRWVLILQLAITIPMIVFGDYMLAVFGPAFAAGSGVLAIVLIAELIDGSFLAVETPLVFKAPRVPPLLLGFAIIIEIVLIAFFASRWGAPGAAAGFLIAVLALTAGRLAMLKKHLDINVVNASYMAPLGLSILVFALLVGLHRFVAADQFLLIALGMTGGVAGYLFLVRSFALSASDRLILRAMALRRRRRAAPA